MSIYERVILRIKTRRERVLNGDINCIPSPFKRFTRDFIGVEQGKYYLITAATKAFKTQFTSFLFIYNSVLYAYNHVGKIKIKIKYFPLEETSDAIIDRFICHLLYEYTEHKIRINRSNLLSTDEKNPVPEEVLKLLEEDDAIKDIIEYFISCIDFSYTSNPTGIYKECCAYAKENGTIHYKEAKVTDEFTGQIKTIEAFDRYTPNDPNLYVLVYIDHLARVSTESGKDQRQSMNKVSEYMILLRDRYNFTPVVIQQQIPEQMENYKLSKLKPSVGSLGDAKDSGRDCNMILGLFAPFRYEIKDYMGYDITKLRKNILFLECIVNRDGDDGDIVPLFVDGAVSYFDELPPPDNPAMKNVYEHIKRLKGGRLSFSFFRGIFGNKNY